VSTEQGTTTTQQQPRPALHLQPSSGGRWIYALRGRPTTSSPSPLPSARRATLSPPQHPNKTHHKPPRPPSPSRRCWPPTPTFKRRQVPVPGARPRRRSQPAALAAQHSLALPSTALPQHSQSQWPAQHSPQAALLCSALLGSSPRASASLRGCARRLPFQTGSRESAAKHEENERPGMSRFEDNHALWLCSPAKSDALRWSRSSE
jgi:hypothetical protein